jgi:hypothetical protein
MSLFTAAQKELSGTLALAYASHVVSGHIVEKVTTGTGDTSKTTLIVLLGEGPWNRIVTAYWGGAEIPSTDYHFHNGYISTSMAEATFGTNPNTGLDEWNQGVDPWNVGGQTYSGSAYVIVRLPTGVSGDEDFGSLKFVCECTRVANYNSAGEQLNRFGAIVGTAGDAPNPVYFFYSTNPALVMADILVTRRKIAKSRIDWLAWTAWRDFNAVVIPWTGGNVPDRPLFQGNSNTVLGADGATIKAFGAANTWDSGVFTTSAITSGVPGFFEADIDEGHLLLGLTNRTTVNPGAGAADFRIALHFRIDGKVDLWNESVNKGQVATWVTGDRFRLTIENDAYRILKYGVAIDTSSLGLSTPVYPLHGGIEGYTIGAGVLRSVVSPAGSISTERTRKRFECGVAFPNQTDIATAIEAVLYVSCATLQDGEKIIFLPPTMAGAPRLPDFDFNEHTNIVPGTLKVYRLSRDQKPTKLTGLFRNLDYPTLKDDKTSADRDSLADLLGRDNPAPDVYLGTMTQGQADCVLNYHIKKDCDLDLYCSFQAKGTSWKVLPGSPVRVTAASHDWVNVEFEVVESTDESSIDTPDFRSFVCQLFNSGTYSDTDQSPLLANVVPTIIHEFDIPATPTGFTADFVLNNIVYKWDKPIDSEYINIAEYEIWSSTNTANPDNRLFHGKVDGWIEQFKAGASNIVTRYLRAINTLGKPSAFASVTKSIAEVIPPSNYTITYAGNTAHHGWSPSNPATGIIRYEIATDAAFTNIIFSGLSTQFDEIVTTTAPITRYLRAIGILEKASTTVSTSNSIGAPNPPTAASSTYDGKAIVWTWTDSTSPNIAYYEITNSAGTAIIERVPAARWVQLQVRGTSVYSSRVYAVTKSSQRSATYLTLSYTIPAPSPVTGANVVFASLRGFISWAWTGSSSVDVESYVLTDAAGVLLTLVVDKNATNATEVPRVGTPVLTRNITVISTNGQVSSAVPVTFTAPTPVAPTIAVVRTYPGGVDLTITSSITEKTVKNTVIEVSTASGGGFSAGIIFTDILPGMQTKASVLGQVSQNGVLYVRVHYVDVWGVSSANSNELACTFPQILGSDIQNGAITFAKFATSLEPVTIVSSVPVSYVGSVIYNLGDGKIYKWNGSSYGVIAASSFSELTGTIGITQFASNIEPVNIVTFVPGTPPTTKTTSNIYNTTDSKLYKWDSLTSTYKTIPFSELTGTISAAQISASTITGSMMVANTITAGQIQAAAIGTNELAALAVTAAKIAALTITADKLAANSITAGQIQAGAIGATEIAANAIRANHMVIGNFDNLAEDPGFERSTTSLTTWTLGEGTSVSTTTIHSGVNAIKRQYTATANSETINNLKIDCKPGDRFYIEGWIYMVASAGGTAGVRMKWYDATSSFISNSDVSGSATAATWTLMGATVTAPANAVFCKPAFIVLSQTANQWYLDDMYVRRVVDGVVIADGTITASKITIDGKLTMNGSASAITIGNPAVAAIPTDASHGTGVWIDRGGLVGLVGDAVQTKWDATTGAFTAAGGLLLLDANGLTMKAGTTNAPNRTLRVIDDTTGDLYSVFYGARSLAGTDHITSVSSEKVTGHNSWVTLESYAASSKSAYVGFYAYDSSNVLKGAIVIQDTIITIASNGSTRIKSDSTGLGFFGATTVAKPTVTGSRGSNAALASLLTAGANLGLWTDSST